MIEDKIIKVINKAWDKRESEINFAKDAVDQVINQLDRGEIRIAEKHGANWVVNQAFKKAVLLSFKLNNSRIMEHEPFNYHDKVDLKFTDWTIEEFTQYGIRAVPGSIVRKAAYIGKNTVLMPSFVNLGAYVDDGTLIDTWATIGCCAQIGKNCHISGGAGIGGVLEPLQANPTIIEDNCFIGARSEVAEGVIVEEGSVLSMGVFLGQSTRIYNRETKEITYGKIPAYSVVVPGSIPSKDGSHSLYAAIIVKQVDKKTRSKTSINELLRF
ncbi:MAG: 2,3,4,5-tetrahydropyridine-2,6-dicarboxylate N-succinyltransferase [Rickettsiales bacterium]|jgi:2,3,4,5-tetrahydropyridine-2-carboxylate N-succinyltransferase|nr:2,3,4,5-tetrahydropyridine-2,6-dicarboxylate N-succinyltransferase [Rickettsiales bacterium]